jgi:hypothetical protein
VAEQLRQALALDANQARVFALPEIAVVHQQRVCATRYGRLDQGPARGDTRHQPAYRTVSGDLQAIRAVVAEALHLERLVEVGGQLGCRDAITDTLGPHGPSISMGHPAQGLGYTDR